MSTKYLAVLVTLLGFALVGQAQQPVQYTLHQFKKAAFHPAYAGMENSLVANGTFRRQWLDLEGSPTNQVFNVNLPLAFFNSGFGLTYELDGLGAEMNTAFRVAYNYQLVVGRTGILAVGIGGGWYQKELDGSLIRTPSGIYESPTIQHNDPLLPNTTAQAGAPSFEAGLYFKNETLEIGLTVREILENPIEFANFNIRPIRSYYLTVGTHHDISSTLRLHPSVFVKSDVVQTQIDFSILASYNDNILFGTSLRGYSVNTLDAVAIIGGINISQNLKLIYGYDITLSTLRNVNSGSHEIMLGYNLNKAIGKGRPPQIIYGPRQQD